MTCIFIISFFPSTNVYVLIALSGMNVLSKFVKILFMLFKKDFFSVGGVALQVQGNMEDSGEEGSSEPLWKEQSE